MLDGPMPSRPGSRARRSGEIIALGAIFAHLEDVVALEAKEGMALVNGAPCAAAALADAALAAHGRLAVLEEAFALALEAVRAPHAHLDPALDGGWRDPARGRVALRRLRALLEDGARRAAIASGRVAFRDAPRLVGWFRRVLQQTEECAVISLAAPGDNPTFAPEDAASPARLLSNAGYHDPRAAPALNALAASFADLASLAAVQATRLAEDPDGLAATRTAPNVTLLSMTALGWAEEARVAAAPDAGLARGQRSERHVVDRRCWRGGSRRMPRRACRRCSRASRCSRRTRSPRRDVARRRGCSARFDEVIGAFPIGSPPRDWSAGLERVAAAIERQVRDRARRGPLRRARTPARARGTRARRAGTSRARTASAPRAT